MTGAQIWRIEYDRTGGPEVLVRRSVTLPAPAPGHVRIAMRAASVNPIDGKIRAGALPPLPMAFPAQTGRDGMGVVTALGPQVDAAWLGRRVAFLAPRGGAGTWAEAVNMPVAVLAAVPDQVTDLQAAALPLAGLSAAAVLSLCGLGPGDRLPGCRVLIHAAAGGVGRIAVQLAHLAGAEVHATASSARQAALEHLGVHRLWPHDAGGFTGLRDMDMVVDLLGGRVHAQSYAVLCPGGLMACLNAAPFKDCSAATGTRVVMAEVVPDPAPLARLLDLVATGQLDPGPAQVLPGSAFAEAQRLSDDGRIGGKLVLDLRNPDA